MAVTKKDIEKTALLARFDLTEKEKDQFTEEINTILNLAENILELDTKNTPPTINILPLNNVMREDIIGVSLEKSDVFQNTSHEEEGMFRVPKII
ncbi:MAG: Asp-tRNA(Asn)/Glu-tRNA(Gln) amidotransferase subunit GatC [Bacillota bacterium]